MPCKNCGQKRSATIPVPMEMTKITGAPNMTYDFAADSDFMLVAYTYPNSAAVIVSSLPDFYEKYGMRNYGRKANGYLFYIHKQDYSNSAYKDRLTVIEVNAAPEPTQVNEKPAQESVEEKPKRRRTAKSKTAEKAEVADEKPVEISENSEE